MHAIPAVGRWRPKDQEFKSSFVYKGVMLGETGREAEVVAGSPSAVLREMGAVVSKAAE